MTLCTIQRPDNRTHCHANWVPLAWGVEVEVTDAGRTVMLAASEHTGVAVGCRVLLQQDGKVTPLLVVGVEGPERGPWLIATVRE
jgi:hypothetical protein